MKDTGAVFVRNTWYDQTSESAQEQHLPQPALELTLPEGAELIPLPSLETLTLPQKPLAQCILERRSLRKYADETLSLAELSILLFTTQGIQQTLHGRNSQATIRTVPSAGARHAFETYLFIQRVEGLQPGLYRYSALNHALVCLTPGVEQMEIAAEACLGQKQVLTSAVTFVWAAVVERMTWRYVERGYRYLYLDAGHVCQNLALMAEALECGICPIAAYDDDMLNRALALDGESAFAIYVASLGKKPAA